MLVMLVVLRNIFQILISVKIYLLHNAHILVPVGHHLGTGVSKGKYVNTLAFGAYKRAEFLKVGAYDEELIRNQDEELNYRMS